MWRALRSLAMSRNSLSAPTAASQQLQQSAVTSQQLQLPVGPASIRHAVTITCLEQIREREGALCSSCGSHPSLLHPSASSLEVGYRAVCTICLEEVHSGQLVQLAVCGCKFCKQCMSVYIETCIRAGEAEVPCPDSACGYLGVLTAREIRDMTSPDTHRLYCRLLYIREVERDPNRVWCPRPGCDSACHLPDKSGSFSCGECRQLWCAVCRLALPAVVDGGAPASPHVCRPERWRLDAGGGSLALDLTPGGGVIKPCPECGVLIERDEGCAQIMCRRCRHVFCWYCLQSLDGDFFLRHYDRAPCRQLLGHTRGSLIWHRIQLAGILLGLALIVIVSAPALILLAPFLICCSFIGRQLDDGELSEEDSKSTSRPPPPPPSAASPIEVHQQPLQLAMRSPEAAGAKAFPSSHSVPVSTPLETIAVLP